MSRKLDIMKVKAELKKRKLLDKIKKKNEKRGKNATR